MTFKSIPVEETKLSLLKKFPEQEIKHSHIQEVSFNVGSGLRVIVRPNGSKQISKAADSAPYLLELFFKRHYGFRFLDEADLQMFGSAEENYTDYILYEVIEDGWYRKEIDSGNIMIETDWLREWWIVSGWGNLNVISQHPPLVRVI